ncbi:MAG: metal ABC transporter substrate-binding protein [Candidatus Baltobacteraceae bacterium]
MPRIVLALLLLTSVAGCVASSHSAALRQAHHDKAIQVVTTFSTLNSFVQGVGGRYVTVRNLVPVGASPETYQPAPQDVATLSRAQLIVENGSRIEAWLQHTLQNAGNTSAPRIVLSDGLPHIGSNPHLWMDPVNAHVYVEKIRVALASLDPPHAREYAHNAEQYESQLTDLQRWISQRLAMLPAQHRTMIIFHNAFDYYNRRFGLQTIGVIELSPGQDPNPAYVGHLVELAHEHGVRAVFSEPEYSPKLAQTLARSAGIRIVSDLYDDSIGSDARVHDYVSMLRYDTQTIVQALK